VPIRVVVAPLALVVAAVVQTAPLLQGIDHVMVAVTNLPAAAERFKALGFALKPGQPHANGIANQHVKFPDGSELELITAPAAVDEMTTNYLAHLRQGDGPAYAGFFAPDRRRLTLRLAQLQANPRTSGAIVTFPTASPLKHLFFGGRNKSPTDRPEHFAHANGATSLIGIWVATDEPNTRELLTSLGALFESITIDLPMPTRADRGRLPEGEILILPNAQQAVPGRRIVGVTMAAKSVESVMAALAAAPADVRAAAMVRGRSVFLPPSIAHGVWIELRAPPY
jgi:catechol 2,3-dioxygenase-like lactoylglutathione lyase family enzyme